MKWKLLFVLCTASFVCFAQKVIVTHGAIVTVGIDQKIPNLKNEGSVVLKEHKTLTLTGTASGTGLLSVTPTSSVTVRSNAGGIVYFNPFKNTLKNLSVYGGFVLGNTLSITSLGKVKLVGELFLNGALVLKSDQYGTAWIDSSAGSIVGEVTVERYIPPIRSWRLLTVPFETTSQTLNTAWQEGYTNTTLACPSQYIGTPGYGTHLTYNGANGYDPNITQNPSILHFASDQNKWAAPPSTIATYLTDYPGYAVFFRGDRTICLTQGINAISVPTTLRATGRLYIGAVTRNFGYGAGKYFLEGNPYASSIDLLPMTKRSVGIVPETFWILDPKLGTVGGYVAYSYGVSTPLTTQYPDATSARSIQSGQAYMLHALDDVQLLRYEETDKTPIQSSAAFGRPIPTNMIRVQLTDDELQVLDGAVLRVTPDTARKTVIKMWNLSGEGVALGRDQKRYAIETRIPVSTDSSFLYFKNMDRTSYVLEIRQTGLEYVRLVDRLLNKEMPVVAMMRYQFTNFDSTSWKDRFMVFYGTHTVDVPEARGGIYPNPVRSYLYSTALIKGDALVIDMTGRRMMTAEKFPINCKRLQSGMYVLVLNGKKIPFQKL